ncbi:GmrSD restriction endonuclease domain-containing protein [Agromyces indicus]|uniref:Excalibur calcium-binding domain-containing protein n=1 Tax=Agromyces indicus TaxID=758919 RepID=A0ABU1FLV9_9MICO|nr:DUF1524 domain-containing protein [Agromyces indicus]MDR5692746.1 excalibur calcium-binding domain-containing protein [Agromyces indicus]
MGAAPTPPAGWYPDPTNASLQRYWDGESWVERRAAAIVAGPSAGNAPRGWFAPLTLLSWVVIAALSLLTVIAFASTGVAGGFIMIGLIGLVTGTYAVVAGRGSWARTASRKGGAAVLVGGLLTTIIGSALYGAATPGASPSVAGETGEQSLSPTPAERDAPEPVAATVEGQSVGASDGPATEMTALQLLEAIPIKGRAPKTGFDRAEQFGTAWLDVDRNGCDTRNDILSRDLEHEVTSGPCKVISGALLDPYTGNRIQFVRGNETSRAVQIDHVVSLMNAWETGAQQLTQAQRISFANDPINLFAVDGPTNLQKGAGDAATWLPPEKKFRCTYVARQVSVKATYGLWVTQAEHDAMARILGTCPDEPAVTSDFAPIVAPPTATEPPSPPAHTPAPEPEPAPFPAPEPAPSVDFANCTEVRAVGAAPIRAGDPGYSRQLDRDGDGVACE